MEQLVRQFDWKLRGPSFHRQTSSARQRCYF